MQWGFASVYASEMSRAALALTSSSSFYQFGKRDTRTKGAGGRARGEGYLSRLTFWSCWLEAISRARETIIAARAVITTC